MRVVEMRVAEDFAKRLGKRLKKQKQFYGYHAPQILKITRLQKKKKCYEWEILML